MFGFLSSRVFLLLTLTFTVWYYAYFMLYRVSVFPLYGDGGTLNFKRINITKSTNFTIPSDQLNNIFHFAHISDVHVSRYPGKSNNHGGVRNLKKFLEYISILKPKFILVTGDLTDAKDEWKVSSRQFYEEWSLYYSTLKEAGITEKKNFWLDQRGNHDCFNVFHSSLIIVGKLVQQ
jgi:predicted MPP superfamily phosphohydrolase